MNLTSDREILDYLMERARTSGIPMCEISVWAHRQADDKNEYLTFYVKTADPVQTASCCDPDLDKCIAEVRAKIVPEAQAKRDKARKLREDAEKLLAEADALNGEITLPPSPEMIAEIAKDSVPPPMDAGVVIPAALSEKPSFDDDF